MNDDSAKRIGRRLGMSAWLPPGLAIAWLAVLAIFLHRAGPLLEAWAATSGFAILSVLAGVRFSRMRARRSSGLKARSGETVGQASLEHSAVVRQDAGPNVGLERPIGSNVEGAAAELRSNDPVAFRQPPELTPGKPTSLIDARAGLNVLTADEVSAALRIEAETITSAIARGEFPGNHIGPHWRVDRAAIVRWLQGSYKDPAQ